MARPKPGARFLKNGVPVEYNGKVLYFPNGKDLKTVEQAERRADWLSEWIGVYVGETVAVRAIVALPGWTVKRTSADGIPVVNPGQFVSLFEHIKTRPISQDASNRIVHQFEHMCRSAESQPADIDVERNRLDTVTYPQRDPS